MTPLGWKIHNHLNEYRPKMFAELEANGDLLETVNRMDRQAKEKLAILEDQGLQPFEAWEIVKDDVLLPSEEDAPDLNQPIQPYRD